MASYLYNNNNNYYYYHTVLHCNYASFCNNLHRHLQADWWIHNESDCSEAVSETETAMAMERERGGGDDG